MRKLRLQIPARKALLATVLLFACATNARGQGCAQCRDNLGSTPPATQRAYRQAIGLLAGAALTLGCLVIAVARRER